MNERYDGWPLWLPVTLAENFFQQDRKFSDDDGLSEEETLAAGVAAAGGVSTGSASGFRVSLLRGGRTLGGRTMQGLRVEVTTAGGVERFESPSLLDA